MDNSEKNPIISVESLFRKSYRFISSEEALRDVTPPSWDKDILDGKKKVIVGTKDEERQHELRG